MPDLDGETPNPYGETKCPDCRKPMRLLAIVPVWDDEDSDEITSGCEVCKSVHIRIEKRPTA